MPIDPKLRQRLVTGLGLFASLVAAAIVVHGVVLDAWLCDDVYITLRTIDNWINGFGLRWNIVERVQTYTHPLWMFTLSIPYYFTREPYYTTLIVCFAMTAACLLLVMGMLADRGPRGALAILVLGSSQAFVQYSTCGLENSLSDVLIIVYVWVLWRPPSPRRLRAVSFVGALLLLNRLDYLLLVGPSVLFEFWPQRSRAALKEMIIGGLPLIAWELFSFVYYGSLVPNTAYAKLGYDIPRMAVIEQGFRWVNFSVGHDWVTVAAVALSALLAFVARDRRSIGCVVGALLYVSYTIWIGGDFMGGRFWVGPFVLSVGVLAQRKGWIPVVAMVALVASSFALPLIPIPFGGNPRTGLAYQKGVWDEHCSYFQTLGLINVGWGRRGPLHEWAQWGIREAKGVRLTVRSAVGMHGYYAGPGLHVIDDFGLCDPLLARLKPLPTGSDLPVGHLRRNLPYGYFQSVLGQNQVLDPNLHAYYEVLHDVTRGPIFSLKRLGRAALLVLGVYNRRLERYEKASHLVTLPVEAFKFFAHEDDQLSCEHCISFVDSAEIRSDAVVKGATTCAVLTQTERFYSIQFLLDDRVVGDVRLHSAGRPWLVGKSEIKVPDGARMQGFNRVMFTGTRGEPPFHIGGIECQVPVLVEP
jgi:arabinofuranosyltransferase